ESLHAKFLQAGGSDISDLQQLIAVKLKNLETCERNLAEYRVFCKRFELPETADRDTFTANRQRVVELKSTTETEKDKAAQVAARHAGDRNLKETEIKELKAELDA